MRTRRTARFGRAFFLLWRNGTRHRTRNAGVFTRIFYAENYILIVTPEVDVSTASSVRSPECAGLDK